MKILFTGGRAPATLELVRNFGRSGWEVHVADSLTPVLSQFSKYANSFHHINSPHFAEPLFVADLIKIINVYKIDILFPTCEEIFWIAKNKKKILNSCSVRIICDDMEKLSLLHNKHRFMEFARAEGILTPETVIYEGKNILRKKAVIKPIFSRFGEDVAIIESSEENNCCKNGHILQEFIEGENVCSYGFADNGILKFNICYKSPFKTHQAFTAFVPFECDAINKVVTQIMKKLNFTGNISFDFIEKEEQYYIIECNPRITSGIHIICKNDFARLFFNDYDTLLRQKTQLLIPTLITKLKFLFYKDVVFDLHDSNPFFKQISCLKMFDSIAKKNKISLTKATVIDIEWNGEDVEIAQNVPN